MGTHGRNKVTYVRHLQGSAHHQHWRNVTRDCHQIKLAKAPSQPVALTSQPGEALQGRLRTVQRLYGLQIHSHNLLVNYTGKTLPPQWRDLEEPLPQVVRKPHQHRDKPEPGAPRWSQHHSRQCPTKSLNLKVTVRKRQVNPPWDLLQTHCPLEKCGG